MTERQKLVERARKVAALMTSPVEGEMIAASVKLKQLLTEHNLTLKELGLQNLNLNPSRKVAEYDDTIIEVINKVPYSLMNIWIRDMFVKVTRAYGVRGFVNNDRLTFVGYASDVEIVKIMVVSLRGFILSQISKRGYTDDKAAHGYAFGIVDKVVKSIGSTVDHTKTATLAEYMLKNHGIYEVATQVNNFRFSCSAYQTGKSDADGYNV